MKKISSLWCGIAGHALVVVMVSGILCSCLVLPAAAAGTTPNFFAGWTWKESGEPVQQLPGQNAYGTLILSPSPLVPEPPYSTDNPGNPGTYSGPCPVGGTVPQLRQTGLSTGAECRGACGMDCPEERCRPVDDVKIVVDGGLCTYSHAIRCNSHEGCINHDACYDYCSEKQGETSLVFGSCHGVCNQRCYDEYGYTNCFLWAALPGSASSTFGLMMDVATAPLTDKYLVFSDEPVFTPQQEARTPDNQQCDSVNPYDCWKWP